MIVRLSAGAPDHPAIVGLDDAALALWLRAVCYCARHDTGRRVPAAALPALRRRRSAAAERALEVAKVWALAGDGYELAALGLVLDELTPEESRRAGWRAKKARQRAAQMSPVVPGTCPPGVPQMSPGHVPLVGTHPRTYAPDPDLSPGSGLPDPEEKKIQIPPPLRGAPQGAHGGQGELPGVAPAKAPLSKPKAAAHPLPADWKPSPAVYLAGEGVGLNRAAVDRELQLFRDHAAANDRRAVRWDAAACLWIRRSVQYAPRGSGSAPPASSLQPTGGWTPSTHAEREARRKATGT